MDVTSDDHSKTRDQRWESKDESRRQNKNRWRHLLGLL